jgi:broad specificity phosphatase PhoE
MDFLYIRHEKTDFSINKLFAGRRDIPLAKLSAEDVNVFLQRVRHHPRPMRIYHSPLLRAVQTKDILVHNLELSFIDTQSNELLIERDFGIFEGQIKNKNNRLELDRCLSVEPFEYVKIRAKRFIEYTMGDDFFWLIGHSSFYRALRCVTGQEKLPLDIGCGESIYFNLS